MRPIKKSAPTKWSKFAPWLALLLANLAAAILLGGHFFANRAIFWDNGKLYSIFRGNNHALNYYGQVMWWDPTISFGFPSFYFSHLGTNTFTPLSSLVLFMSWMLGRFGIVINDFTRLYIVYFSFLVPLLFSVAVYLLACQIFRNFYMRLFVIIMTAFSPGVVFNYTDNGLEQTAYGVYFAAAFLYFYNAPNRRSFWLLISASCMLGIAFNHLALYWNAVFAPLFMLAVIVLRRQGMLGPLLRAWNAVPWYGWIGGAVLAGLCLVPAYISFSKGHDILRTKNFGRWYDYDYLQTGNPLEVLSVSTPGIGFNWLPNDPGVSTSKEWNNKWVLQPYSENVGELGYTYMGIMSLPLLMVGLCFGRAPWRARLLFMIAFLTLIMMLEGWSSVFSAVLAMPSPIRAVNHFSDCLFRVGLFLLLILGSALGLEAVVVHRRLHRHVLPVCFACSTVLAAGILIAVHGKKIVSDPLSGYFAAATAVFMLHAFSRGRVQKNSARRRQFVIALLILVAVDVSTVSFWHVRRFMWGAQGDYVDPPPTELALPPDDRSFYAQTLLMLRENYEVLSAGVTTTQLSSIPALGLYNHAAKISPADAKSMDLSSPQTLVLDPDDPGAGEYAEFLNTTPGEPPKARTVELIQQTYNTLELHLVLDAPAILFWRDCDFGGWTATVNNQPASIVRAFWSFKSVKVPAGDSVVRFRYSQSHLLAALLLGYAVVIGTAIAGLLSDAGPPLLSLPAAPPPRKSGRP